MLKLGLHDRVMIADQHGYISGIRGVRNSLGYLVGTVVTITYNEGGTIEMTGTEVEWSFGYR